MLILVDALHYPLSLEYKVWICEAEEKRFRPSDGVLWWSRILVVMVELSISLFRECTCF